MSRVTYRLALMWLNISPSRGVLTYEHPQVGNRGLFIADGPEPDGIGAPAACDIVVVSDEELQAGDKCLFYGQLSTVLEILNPDEPYEKRQGKISTEHVISEDEREFLKLPEAKTDTSIMIHGFTLSQMPKYITKADGALRLKVIHGRAKIGDEVSLFAHIDRHARLIDGDLTLQMGEELSMV